jgi:hypothetical protein
MKKILKSILAFVCLASVLLAGAENPDGSCNLGWTLSFLAIAVLCGLGRRLTEEDGK